MANVMSQFNWGDKKVTKNNNKKISDRQILSYQARFL